MSDLPDYQAWMEAVYLLAHSLEHGADANKSADPDDGDAYLATDTSKLYTCFTDGVWTDITATAIAVHAALTTGIHGAGSNYIAHFGQENKVVNKVIWKDASELAVTDDDRIASLEWTDFDLTAYTSANAKFALLQLLLRADTVGTGNDVSLSVRKNGTTPAAFPKLVLFKDGTTVGRFLYQDALVALDSGQVIEYKIVLTTDWQVDSRIHVIGYIE